MGKIILLCNFRVINKCKEDEITLQYKNIIYKSLRERTYVYTLKKKNYSMLNTK